MKRSQIPSTVVVPAERKCPRCGGTMDGFGPEGLCGVCMFDAALAADESPPAPDALPSGARRFGDYELMEEIARGGMGVVFKARQGSLNRIVAVKMILRGEFAGVAELARFRAEAETAAHLQHPSIVAIHEVGEHEGQPFFSMDYVAGQNLAQLVGSTPLPAMRAAKYLRTIAEAVQHAHQHGVLHRDLKPSNVLIDSATDTPRVTDFGLAKRVEGDASLTMTGQVLGSPNFMPPEQAAGKNEALGPASDVYSLGALLYHSLTGRPPFVAESVTATLRLVAENDAVSPRLLNGGMPRDLETICLKCLQKEPSRRYASAQELADELDRFLRDEPIRARPVALVEKFWRWCRRHPALAGVSALALALVVAVVTISTTAAVRLKAANQEAREKLRESYLAQARANRWSGRPGRRFDSLDALGKAAGIRPGIDLRDEAVAAMALVDLRAVKSWDLAPNSVFKFDSSYEHYLMGPTNGPLILHRLADDQPIARHTSLPKDYRWVELSPKAGFLSVYSGPTNALRLEIFKWGISNPVFTLANMFVRSLHFSSDDRLAAIGGTALTAGGRHQVMVIDLSTGETNLEFVAHTLPSVRFSPTADKLAVFGHGSADVEIRAVPSGQLLETLRQKDGVSVVAWSADGRQLVIGATDRNVYLWNLIASKPDSAPLNHGSFITAATLSPEGGLVASRGWDDRLQLWEARTGRSLLRQSNSELGSFSPDGRLLAAWPALQRAELCEVASAGEVRVVPTGVRYGIFFGPEDRLIATVHSDGLRFWEVASGRDVGFLPEADAVLLGSHGQNLLTASPAGTRCWSLTQHRVGGTNFIELAKHPVFCRGDQLQRSASDRTAQRFAVIRAGWLEVYDANTGKSLFPRSRQSHIEFPFFTAAISPDGEWVATCEATIGSAHVWEIAGSDRGHDLVPETTGVAFSPDGQWLVTGTGTEYACWAVRSWKPGRRFPRPVNSGVHAMAVFHPDGRTLALKLTERSIGLYDFKSGDRLATLESPGDVRLGAFMFDTAGDRMAAPDLDSGGMVIWDLRLIRRNLASMGLDWNSPPLVADRKPDEPCSWQFTWTNAPFAPRDPRCTARQIDLSSHYNATFPNLNRITSNPDDDLSELPIGFQSLQGIDFDIRGAVQLFTRSNGAPAVETGIEIGQRCRSLHFLHSAILLRAAAGSLAAEYVVHWKDGKVAQVPVRNLVNMADWWCSSSHPLDSNTTVVAWQGKNVASAQRKNLIQLYKFRWDNPRPEVPVATVDFKTFIAVPFLVAITAE